MFGPPEEMLHLINPPLGRIRRGIGDARPVVIWSLKSELQIGFMGADHMTFTPNQGKHMEAALEFTQ